MSRVAARANAGVWVTAALVASGLLSGCVPGLEWHGWSATVPSAPRAEKYPRAPAVILRSETKIRVHWHPRALATTELQHEESRAILTEAGFAQAEFRIPLGEGSTLELLRARTVQPDGSAQEVDARRILVDESRTGGADSKHVTTRLLRFPGVRVGSVLELAYIIVSPGLQWFTSARVPQALPIAHYALELQVTPDVEFAFKLYNSAVVPARREGDDDYARLRFELDDVPARSDLAYLTPWQTREPFWSYRIVRMFGLRNTTDVSSNWATAADHMIEKLYAKGAPLYERAPAYKPPDGCGTVRCKIDWALGLARSEAEWIGDDGDFSPRPLARVLGTATADDNEKALLLFHMLRSAGVDARFAFPSGEPGGFVDRDFPMPPLLTHALLFVPGQADLGTPTWIDPSCERCQAGQIPEAVSGAEAMVLYPTPQILGADILHADLRRVEGEPAPPATDTRTYLVTLNERGDADVQVTEELAGSEAATARRRARASGPADWQRAAESFVTRRAPSGRLAEQSPIVFDRAGGTGSWRLRFTVPGYATLDGTRMLVPLTLFRSAYDDSFPDEARAEPLRTWRDTVTEVIRLRLPPGYRVSVPLRPESASSPDFEYRLLVETEPDRPSVTRRISQTPGTVAAEHYAEIRTLARAFAAARDHVLTLQRAP